MILLKTLHQITGKRYSPIAILKTPQSLRIDSLTYTELLLILEEKFKISFSDEEILEMYRVRLIHWKRKVILKTRSLHTGRVEI